MSVRTAKERRERKKLQTKHRAQPQRLCICTQASTISGIETIWKSRTGRPFRGQHLQTVTRGPVGARSGAVMSSVPSAVCRLRQQGCREGVEGHEEEQREGTRRSNVRARLTSGPVWAAGISKRRKVGRNAGTRGAVRTYAGAMDSVDGGWMCRGASAQSRRILRHLDGPRPISSRRAPVQQSSCNCSCRENVERTQVIRWGCQFEVFQD